jgi:small conductance mechanosensitive channel
MDLTLDDVKAFAEAHLIPLGLKLLVALVIFITGRQVAKIVLRTLDRFMERGRMDVSLRKFLGDVVYAVMLVAIIIAALDAVGVKTTALIAVLGAAGLAIGLALQGSLSNFAAGVMLIVLRPYKVGDLVNVGKYLGRIDAIRVFQTIMITADHREVTIPNGQIIAQPIENLTALGRRRVDLVVTVAQAADLDRVRHLLEGVVTADSRIQQAPPTQIDIAEITDASVKLFLRPWTSTEDYTKVATDTMERIKTTMDAAQLKYSVALQAVT